MVRANLKFAGLDWPVSDYRTLCRHKKPLAIQIPFRRVDGPLSLRVDSTGITFLGVGEWHARKHGLSRRRPWRRVHLAIDTATSDIRAVEFTSSREGDSPTLPDLQDKTPDDEQIGSVTADGASDTGFARPPLSTVTPLPSSRSTETDGSGARTARPGPYARRPAADLPDAAHDGPDSVRIDLRRSDGVLSRTETAPQALARRHACAVDARIARLIAMRYSQSSISALATLCFMSMVRNEWPWTKDHNM
jgi:hypothetical protein